MTDDHDDGQALALVGLPASQPSTVAERRAAYAHLSPQDAPAECPECVRLRRAIRTALAESAAGCNDWRKALRTALEGGEDA